MQRPALTPNCEEHYAFMESLLYEVYNVDLRQRMYDFYGSHGMRVWLPPFLEQRRLKYIVEFDSGYHMITLSNSPPKVEPVR